MSLSKLSISFKCLNSIGNSSDLKAMIKEFVKTFIKESDAMSGHFFLYKKKKYENITSIGKKVDVNLEELELQKELGLIKYKKRVDILYFKVHRGVFLFFYNSSSDFDLTISILKSLENRLNLSIDSCLNVQTLKKQNKELKRKKKKLKELTSNLKDEIAIATKENIVKEKQLYDQLKMAQMGELIGNIAHQWRQPLNVISTAASGLQIKNEMKILSEYDLKEYTKNIIDSSMYLSNTIEEFRDYINESHKVKEVVIQERLETAIKMVESSFQVSNIEIRKGHIEEKAIPFRLILGEMLQVLISILNNAKEALAGKDIEKKWLKYELHQNQYTITISIEDNAGGIDKSIIDKIFNPYFTTKHKSQGTGIGLYTAYDIVVNRLNGRLYVENSTYGAKFFIELPVNMDYVI